MRPQCGVLGISAIRDNWIPSKAVNQLGPPRGNAALSSSTYQLESSCDALPLPCNAIQRAAACPLEAGLYVGVCGLTQPMADPFYVCSRDRRTFDSIKILNRHVAASCGIRRGERVEVRRRGLCVLSSPSPQHKRV